jgi:hypothetical protein
MPARTPLEKAWPALYAALLLTAVMVLFPPFTSLGGTEYAFVLTGPAWSQAMGSVGRELGLEARLHWPLLCVQLGVVWAAALGLRRLLVASPERAYGRS